VLAWVTDGSDRNHDRIVAFFGDTVVRDSAGSVTVRR
jgi:hypothetical protein